MRVDYFGDDACHGQQIDVLPDRRAVNVFQNVGVLDFRPDISSDEIEHVLHPHQISRGRVFLKIFPVGLDDRIVDVSDVTEFTASRVDAHCAGHAADKVVAAEQVQEALVNYRAELGTESIGLN
jgi:hypothetical protein